MRRFDFLFRSLVLTLGALTLVACAGSGTGPTKAPAEPGGHYKVGQPYQIKGIWYYPHEDFSYDETGIASWYGTEFSGLPRTANGELFNKDELTAAHKTLPLPSLARVTNLENGRSIVVRINDRGPFSGARIIDVSQRTAQLLDFEKKGTAKVRVQVLADESKAIADAMRRYGSSTPPAVAGAAAPQVAVAQSQPSAAAIPVEEAPLPEKLTVQNVKPVQEYKQLAVSGANQIYIQAGAFANHENATRLQHQLSALGTARVTETMVKGTKFYRVRVGPVRDVAQADALIAKVTRSGVQGARTVVE